MASLRLTFEPPPPQALISVTAVSRPLTTCMPPTRGKGRGKNCVSHNAYMLFVIADFRFPVAVVHTLSPLVLSGPQNVPHPTTSTPSFRSFRIPSCSFPSLPQFAVASPVKVASKIHSRTSLVAPQYTYHTHVHAVHLSCRHIFGHVISARCRISWPAHL